MSPSPSVVVFSDFDGTITVNETLRKVFLHFLPELAPTVLANLDQKKISLRSALIELVSAVPSASSCGMSRCVLVLVNLLTI
jgi:2-hydroxy-3-keto-5-methylthiopentenyl-1-phosphate phosphatase